MTSAITIDRMGLDIVTPSLSTWEDDGNTVTIEGINWALGVAEGRALRQQILGLASDPTLPRLLTSADDPHRDGYYRVLGATVTSEALLLDEGHISWSMTLERPLNFAGLRPVLLMSGTDRSSKPVGITAKHWVAIPEGYGWGAASGSLASQAGYLVDGTLVQTITGSALDPRNRILLTGDPAYHFVAAATTKIDGYPVIGRQTARNPADWELSNGFVTITPGVSDSAIFTMTVQNPNGTQPAPTESYEIELGRYVAATWTPGTDRTVTSVQVMRETVEEQVVRFSGIVNLDGSSVARNAYSVDLSLRRGALGVDLTFAFVEGDYYGLGWVTADAGGYTTISAENTGFYQTVADADGMSPVIVHPPSGFIGAWTRDLTNGRCYFTGAEFATATFFIGAANQSLANFDAADLQSAYFSTVRARQRMVAP